VNQMQLGPSDARSEHLARAVYAAIAK
jgi:hypothetical protein